MFCRINLSNSTPELKDGSQAGQGAVPVTPQEPSIVDQPVPSISGVAAPAAAQPSKPPKVYTAPTRSSTRLIKKPRRDLELPAPTPPRRQGKFVSSLMYGRC